SLKSSDNGDGLVTLKPLDTTGVPPEQLKPKAQAPAQSQAPQGIYKLDPVRDAELWAMLEANGAQHGGSTCHESGATPESRAKAAAAGSGGYH
ncbi:MAG: hypothetical protein RSA00_06530, partial [Hydrogenoanaerobacterium sp.]